VVTTDTSPQFLLRVMRAGVREVVTPEDGGDPLVSAFRRQFERLSTASGRAKAGRVLAFMPAKGGAGATFLATSLAHALTVAGQRVAFIDLNLQFGDALLHLTDRRPTSDISNVAREIHRIDASMLESSMLEVAPNLWLLPAPESPEYSVEVRPDSVERIIALLRRRYDFVILDIGRIMESVSVRALDEAERVYVILQASMPALHDARRLLAVLSGLGYDQQKLQFVVNRFEKASEIDIGQIQKTLGRDVHVQVPESAAAVLKSVNHGVPILKESPRDPVARAISDWAAQLAPVQEKRTGWLRGVLGGRP
jgi:pilus assembly protein CpaE